jgi:hypothetical protein
MTLLSPVSEDTSASRDTVYLAKSTFIDLPTDFLVACSLAFLDFASAASPLELK